MSRGASTIGAVLISVFLAGAITRSSERREVRLIVTASVAGELSTCGCRTGPQGGLARRSVHLARWRTERPGAVLLDGGGYASVDSLVGSVLTDSLRAYMKREGYAALALGDEEVAAGLAETIGKDGDGPADVSANLHRRREGRLERVGEEFVIVRSGEVTVGITSVVSPELVRRSSPGRSDLVVSDPESAARAALEAMNAAGSELDVLLAHVSEAEAFALGRTIGGFEVVVIGHDPRVRRTHGVDEGTVYVHAGTRGRYLALVDLVLDADGLAWLDGGTYGVELRDEADPGVHRFVMRTLDEADVVRRRALTGSPPPPVPHPPERGAMGCASCHAAESAQWSETAHADALETLEAIGMARVRACAGCHTGDPGARAGESPIASGHGVGCQACHEVPPGHPVGAAVPAVEPGACGGCHDAVNSPGFDLETYWERILHAGRRL